jgi:hypothetical protein
MRKLVKILVLVAILAAAALGAYAWLHGNGKGKNGFKLVDATKGAITEKAIAVGKIEPRLKFEDLGHRARQLL